MSAQDAWNLATEAREGINRERYGGEAPHDSNALTEVWPTAHGAAFTAEAHGILYVVMVCPAEAAPRKLSYPYWPET